MKGKTEKRTIGLLVSGIMDGYTESICKGVQRAARDMGVNIVVFPGKYMDRDLSDDRELRYEYQYSTVFAYAKNAGIDALVVAADCIGCFTSKQRVTELLEQYGDVPVVLVASKLEGYEGVTFDNYQGIKEGLEYLITEKGYTRFAMIGGSEENMDAHERKQAFVSVLAGHHIPFEEKMFVEGDLTRRCRTAFRKILDANPDVEAIFCVNDDTAFGLYEELQRRGISIGKEIAVFGYDDTVEATQASPPLASVRADAAYLGEEALRMACARIEGKKLESRQLPARFIMRKSVSVTGPRADKDSFYRIEDFDANFAEIFHRNLSDELAEKIFVIRNAYKKLILSFAKHAAKGFRDENADAEISACADAFFESDGMKYADVDVLLSHFEMAYTILRSMQVKEEGRTELRDIFFNLYRKTVRAMNAVIGDMEKEKMKESYDMKLFVQDILQFEKGKDQSYGVLLEKLDWLSIKNAELYMFDKPMLHLFKEPFCAPKNLYLKVALKDGVVVTIPAAKQKRKFETIYADMGKRKSSYRIVMPLFSNELLYGILLCDMSDAIHANGELMVNQLSSAVKMLRLLESNEKIQQQLEDNLATLKDSNIKLDNLSKSDALTGIYNRRGFYDMAEEMIADCHKRQCTVLAAYVDMNNLKIINDRYGHEEGDFSLKLIGSILRDVAGEKGVAGRIGGDEYAFVVPYGKDAEGSEVLEDLYARFERFNEKSDKDYNITVSAGACLMSWQDEISLKDALLQADERLYLVKQNRKKDVAKRKEG